MTKKVNNRTDVKEIIGTYINPLQSNLKSKLRICNISEDFRLKQFPFRGHFTFSEKSPKRTTGRNRLLWGWDEIARKRRFLDSLRSRRANNSKIRIRVYLKVLKVDS